MFLRVPRWSSLLFHYSPSSFSSVVHKFMVFMKFLEPNLAVAVAAAIAVVDLRHDGYENEEWEEPWWGGRSASPQGVGRI